MTGQPFRFVDGDAYERFMGKWSLLAGDIFLDWLKPAPGLAWIDVGCGNGAFSELITRRCAPGSVHGIDPSPGLLAHARQRIGAHGAQFTEGDAMAMPWPAASFDAAVMALVIFFVPEPAAGVAEMVRVTRPGGLVSAYAWDILHGSFPVAPMQAELRALGFPPALPPRPEASSIDAMRTLWANAGLEDVETLSIPVQRVFDDFEHAWTINLMGPAIADAIASLPESDVAKIKAGLRARLPVDGNGRIIASARANAVKGRKPK